MAEVSDESVSFAKFTNTRCRARYGTTSSAASSRVNNTDAFVRHTVRVGDTLQGIAVKYGVSVSAKICHSQ